MFQGRGTSIFPERSDGPMRGEAWAPPARPDTARERERPSPPLPESRRPGWERGCAGETGPGGPAERGGAGPGSSAGPRGEERGSAGGGGTAAGPCSRTPGGRAQSCRDGARAAPGGGEPDTGLESCSSDGDDSSEPGTLTSLRVCAHVTFRTLTSHFHVHSSRTCTLTSNKPQSFAHAIHVCVVTSQVHVCCSPQNFYVSSRPTTDADLRAACGFRVKVTEKGHCAMFCVPLSRCGLRARVCVRVCVRVRVCVHPPC